MTDDLAAFLAARLGEDEAAARAATPGPWTVGGSAMPWIAERITGGDGRTYVVAGSRYEGESPVFEKPADAAHIALHDPARALKEVEAGRRLLARYEHFRHPVSLLERTLFPSLAEQLLACIRDRAAVYDSHPDYRQEWKP